jgi:hypothetical protein
MIYLLTILGVVFVLYLIFKPDYKSMSKEELFDIMTDCDYSDRQRKKAEKEFNRKLYNGNDFSF